VLGWWKIKYLYHIKFSVLKDLDPAESISSDWTVTSMSDEVLKHAADFPQELKTVTEEDVRLLDKCLAISLLSLHLEIILQFCVLNGDCLATRYCHSMATWWPYVFASVFYYYFLNDFCQPNYLNFHWTDFHLVFTSSYTGCRWTIWVSIFDPSRDVAIATSFCFLQFRFHAVTPKRNEIGV